MAYKTRYDTGRYDSKGKLIPDISIGWTRANKDLKRDVKDWANDLQKASDKYERALNKQLDTINYASE